MSDSVGAHISFLALRQFWKCQKHKEQLHQLLFNPVPRRTCTFRWPHPSKPQLIQTIISSSDWSQPSYLNQVWYWRETFKTCRAGGLLEYDWTLIYTINKLAGLFLQWWKASCFLIRRRHRICWNPAVSRVQTQLINHLCWCLTWGINHEAEPNQDLDLLRDSTKMGALGNLMVRLELSLLFKLCNLTT